MTARSTAPSGRVRRGVAAAVATFAAVSIAGCASPRTDDGGERPSIVTTTGILADLAQHVVGDRMDVHSLVPPGADPHSYEPSLRDVRDVVYADAAFSNYLLLEGRAIIRTLDANVQPDVPNVSLAEEAVKYAAEIIPLVENVSLDTIWLGMRVRGTGEERGADRTSQVRLRATAVEGPGELVAYLTETFGTPSFYIDSSDGIGDTDATSLPPDAHTHMSWAFTEPGVYRLTLEADLLLEGRDPVALAPAATVTFAVGVDPYAELGEDVTVLGSGHADVTVDLDEGEIYLYSDPHGGGDATQRVLPADEVVVEVPTKALHELPAGSQYRFLGPPGEQVYQLPQAVLGAHVHGEIDPHLWQDVGNAQAYVEIIRDTVIGIDPEGADHYRSNAAAYLLELADLDAYVQARIDDIPPSRRHLVTTHDAFGYLGSAYGIDIAGFVTPNPSTEPSIQERRRLVETIQNLHVPAVFLEPNLIARSSTLTEIAGELGVRVCRIYGDAFDDEITTYTAMMRFNADSLHDCLS
ncbi:anchored repeat ABC transporter, substrate-binding protein [Salana multivorans]|uniref:anchored repeat ABC transporter, substrate-binding protein n=1 Tax=Salana multivorans TaxID=120377 RepID=UPI000AEACA4D|nr:anchored repeat ABC transporter, substrate-binding protein [Salana multivorans]